MDTECGRCASIFDDDCLFGRCGKILAGRTFVFNFRVEVGVFTAPPHAYQMSENGTTRGTEQQQAATDTKKDLRPLDRRDSLWARQTNYANWSLGRLSKEDEDKMFQLEEIRNWGKLLKNCEKRREYLLNYSKARNV